MERIDVRNPTAMHRDEQVPQDAGMRQSGPESNRGFSPGFEALQIMKGARWLPS